MRPSLLLVGLVTVSLLALSVSAQDSTEKTKMIIEVIRHGARVPVYPVGNADWMKGLQSGDLTILGLRQHYLLGKELAKRYSEFFGEKLAFDEFYVRSSGYERTVNSAIAHLMGIWNHFDPSQLDFPDNDIRVLPAAVTIATSTSFRTPLPKGYLPDAIHTEDQDQEMLLAPLQSRVCPKMNQLSQKMTDEISKEMEGKAEFRSKVEEAAKKYGITIKSSKPYADYCREMGDFAIQDVRNNPDPVIKATDDLYKVLLRCTEGHMMIRYTDPAMKKVVVAELVKEITTKLKAKAEDKGSLKQKYHLYSGHDVTILPLLALLDAADANCYINDFKQTKYTPECKGFPDTASNLVFELVSTGSGSTAQNFVKMSFNFEPVDACGLKNKDQAFRCPIDKFVQTLTSRVSQNQAVDCATEKPAPIVPTKKPVSKWRNYAWVVVAVNIVLFIALIAICTVGNNRKRSNSAVYYIDPNRSSLRS